MKCKNCGFEFSGKFCPECGAPADGAVNELQQQGQANENHSVESSQIHKPDVMSEEKQTTPKKKPIYKNWWFWVIIVVAVIIIGAFGTANKKSESKSNNSSVSSSESADESKSNKPTGKPTEKATEKPTEDPALSEEEFKNSCESIDFETLSRNPDKYKGNNYTLTGQVIQVQESSFSDTVDLRINVTKKTYEYIDDVTWTDTIYATVHVPDGEDRILENDVLTFWGTCDGMYTYESVLGSSVSLPKIDIKYYELNS
ncbi:MAG: hypothetical protein SOZ45_05460 [Ruminococcus sp.]|nr:hypothetical protein [Ruminococcus sp.]